MFRVFIKIVRICAPWLIPGVIFSGVGLGLNECARAQEVITDFPLYYSLGGNKATDSPAAIDSSLSLLSTNTSMSSSVCGSFKQSADIQDMLSNQLNDALTSLSAIPQTITSALPGYVLCRAKPGLCQLLQHYVVRAEKKWDLSVKSCEETMQDLANGKDPFQDLMKVSRVQTWQQQAILGSSATVAKRRANNADGCVKWIEGKKSGCKGSEPIWLITDTTEAGWCLLLNQRADCKSAPSSGNSEKTTHLQQTWQTPQAASEWITDVLGDYGVQAGVNASTIAGTGLLPKIDEENTYIQSSLTELVYSGLPPQESEIENLRTNQITLSASLIDALRDLPDRDFLIARISNEIALARTIEKAILARRLLLSGLMEPNIQSSGTTPETVNNQIDILEREIERATFEMQISRRLVSDTVLNVLRAHRSFKTPGPSVRPSHELLLQ